MPTNRANNFTHNGLDALELIRDNGVFIRITLLRWNLYHEIDQKAASSEGVMVPVAGLG